MFKRTRRRRGSTLHFSRVSCWPRGAAAVSRHSPYTRPKHLAWALCVMKPPLPFVTNYCIKERLACKLTGRYQLSGSPAASRARLLNGRGRRLSSTCSSTRLWNMAAGSLPCALHKWVNHYEGDGERISLTKSAVLPSRRAVHAALLPCK